MSNVECDDTTDSSTFLLLPPGFNSSSKRERSHPPPRPRQHSMPNQAPKRLALAFITIYLAALLFFSFYSARDPTSVFFNESLGYSPHYSQIRAAQASEFITRITNGSFQPTNQREHRPRLCLAVPTVARPGQQYVREAIGSLLEGLSDTERAQLHLILFIAHIDPHTHPVSTEAWTRLLPDRVLSYGTRGYLGVSRRQIRRWEAAKAYIPKGLFDYAVALDACVSTGAPLVAILEGDILAARGWFARALRAADAISEPALSLGGHDRGGSTSTPGWLYLRLFYTETYLGWNREYWRTYVSYSLFAFTGVLCLCLILRRRCVPLSRLTIAFTSCVALPAAIVLVFLAGRITVLPLSPGVVSMERFGCCSQAMLFPAAHVSWLVSELQANWRVATEAAAEAAAEGEPKTTRTFIPYVDMLLEHLAAERRLARWATVPALVQHVGRRSSKGDAVADGRARRIWNFAFEDLDADRGVEGVPFRIQVAKRRRFEGG